MPIQRSSLAEEAAMSTTKSPDRERSALVRFDVFEDISADEPDETPNAVPSATFAVVPTLNEGERASLAAGGRCCVELSDHLPEHEALLDYLIERSFAAWTRSQG
jgi:hypothetical protein